MTTNIVLTLSVVALTILILISPISRQVPKASQRAQQTLVQVEECLPVSETFVALQTLQVGRYEEQQNALAFLRDRANRSNDCRRQVIKSLMSAMDQPNLDLTGGTSQFFLWHYGTRLLSELKAVEALDLLVANMDLHDGTPFPFDHHPALGAVIDMGEIALPKLQRLLLENSDRYTRQYAVFCIAQIGGQLARQILTNAINKESDPCVSSCIRASLNSFKNKRRPNHISDVGRTAWYSTFLCQQG